MSDPALGDNVDAAEIAKFESLAERWWDRDGEFRPLHEINPLRLGFIEKHCTIAQAKALDVGCGGGILTEALAYRGAALLSLRVLPRQSLLHENRS